MPTTCPRECPSLAGISSILSGAFLDSCLALTRKRCGLSSVYSFNLFRSSLLLLPLVDADEVHRHPVEIMMCLLPFEVTQKLSLVACRSSVEVALGLVLEGLLLDGLGQTFLVRGDAVGLGVGLAGVWEEVRADNEFFIRLNVLDADLVEMLLISELGRGVRLQVLVRRSARDDVHQVELLLLIQITIDRGQD